MELPFTFESWEKVSLLSTYFSLNMVLDIFTYDIMFNSNNHPNSTNSYPYFTSEN